MVTLKEGITPETFQNQFGQMLEAVKTDLSGSFKTTAPLRCGGSYGIIVARGYRNIERTIAIGPNESGVLVVQGLAMQPR